MKKISSLKIMAIAALLMVASSGYAAQIGPGSGITDAGDQDTAGQDRLNVDRTSVSLPAGTYNIGDFRLNVIDHTQGGTITPMLLSGAPSSYTTLWVGAAFNPIADGVQTVPESGSFTLASATDVYAGYFTASGGGAIIALDANNSGSGSSTTDHDNSFTAPTGAGQAVTGFLNGYGRTYAFEINISFAAPFTYVPITGDADSGISTNNTYTHKLDFGADAGATINDVAFDAYNAFANGTLGFSRAVSSGTADHIGNRANHNVTGNLVSLMADMYYNGSCDAGGTTTWTLSGLTPGVTYDARIYTRAWSASAGTRNVTLVFDPDGAGPISDSTWQISEDDATQIAPGLDAFNDAYYINYRFTAVSGEDLVITATQDVAGTSWHLYGISCQIAPPITYTKITGDADCGISTDNTYTHKLDFGNGTVGATINSVAFNAYRTNEDGTLNFSRTISSGAELHNGGNAGHNVTGDLANLMTDMFFNSQNSAGGTTTWTLSGLTAGRVYDARIYTRQWGADANRLATIVFDPDGSGPISDSTGQISEDDATQAPPGLSAGNDAYYINYRFTAVSGEDLVITATQHIYTYSWHLYGISCQDTGLKVWDGGGADNNMQTLANWDGDTKPSANDVLKFSGTTRTNPNNDYTAGTAFNGIEFLNSTAGESFTLGGYSINLAGDISNYAAVGGTIADEISLDLELTGADRSIDLNTNHNLTVSGAISEDASARGLTKTGEGTLTLSDVNTYTGGTTVSGGTLVLDDTGKGNPAKILPENTDLTITSATVSFVGNQHNNVHNKTAGLITINAGGTLSADQTTFNAHNIFNLSLNGGALTAGAGTLGGAVANWFVNGSISATDNSTISASLGAVAASAALPVDVASGKNLLVSGQVVNIGGANGLTKTGDGTLTLAANNTYTGLTTVNVGTLKAGSDSAFATSGQLTVSGGTFDLSGYNAAFTQVNSSAGLISNSVAGVKTLDIGSATGALANEIAGDVALRVSNNNNLFRLTHTGSTFSGGLALIGTGSGTRLYQQGITGTPYGTGAITIGEAVTDKAGILFVTADQALANDIIFNTALGTDRPGIRSDVTGITFSGEVSASLTNATFSSNGTGSFNLTGKVTGNNGLKLDNTYGSSITVTLNNAADNNDYQGTTIIEGTKGTLVLGRANQIPNGASAGDVVNSGTLNMGGFSETINGLSGSGTIDGISGTPTLTLGDNDATASFSGTIKDTAGTLSLVKTGSGTQTLVAATSYAGATTVDAGTLVLDGNASFANYAGGQISINNGSVLQIQNSHFFQNKTFVFDGNGGGNIDIGSGNNVFRADNTFTTLGGSQDTITQSSTWGLNCDNFGTRTFNVADGSDSVDLLISAQISNNGSVVKDGAGTMALAAANTYSGGTTVDGGTLLVNNACGSGAVNVNATATLGGTGTIAGLVTVASTGHVSPGDNSGDTLTLSDGLTLENGSVLDIAVDTSGSDDDLISITGGTFTGAGTGGVTVNVTLSTTAEGTYTLMDWTGADLADGVATDDFNLVCSGTGNYSLSVTGQQLILSVSNGGTLFKFK
ncbi:MAG: hypothetical protein HN341_09560 [Verrucomicrobia bacterium]|nr:hypothetical protein [Verrucomicrobiota bacterium]